MTPPSLQKYPPIDLHDQPRQGPNRPVLTRASRPRCSLDRSETPACDLLVSHGILPHRDAQVWVDDLELGVAARHKDKEVRNGIHEALLCLDDEGPHVAADSDTMPDSSSSWSDPGVERPRGWLWVCTRLPRLGW